MLKIVGLSLAVAILGIATVLAWNWTIVHTIWVSLSGSVADVEKFTPRQVVKGCSADALPRFGSDNPLPPGVFEEMKAYSDSFGGVGLMVLIDGKVAGETYREGANDRTRTLSFSMHKSVMALSYGAAIEDGIIQSIDDPIGQYVEEWEGDPRGEIPLRAFLTMSSGLERPSQFDWRGIKLNFSDAVSETALTLPQEREPFTQFHYNNSESQLAGVALNRALQAQGVTDYATYLSGRIWCPIGAKDALLWPEKEGGDPRFFAFLDASLDDWARVGLLMIQNGEFGGKQIVSSDWIEAMKSPAATNPKYGLQIWLGTPHVQERTYFPGGGISVKQEAPFLAPDVIFFDGMGGQRVYVVPSTGLIIVRSGEIDWEMDDGVLVNLAISGLKEGAQAE